MRFGLSGLLLAIAFVAVAIAGSQFAIRAVFNDSAEVYALAALLLPLWLPVAMCAFAIGRRQLTVRMVVVFAVLEAASIGVSKWAASTWTF
jgi:hypothetical protein